MNTEYDPANEDALPTGFWDATPVEQKAYWDSRSRYFYEREQRRIAAIERSLKAEKRSMALFYALIRDSREQQRRQWNCLHKRTIRVSHRADEVGDVVLDPEVERICRDCPARLGVVA